jgi:hypothetical protein
MELHSGKFENHTREKKELSRIMATEHSSGLSWFNNLRRSNDHLTEQNEMI